MKFRKLIALLLVLTMVVSFFPAVYASEEPDDPWSIEDAAVTTDDVVVNGERINVTMYVDYYLKDGAASPGGENAKIAVYVPEGANENSPILYVVNNAGWGSNTFAEWQVGQEPGINTEANGSEDLMLRYSTDNRANPPTTDDIYEARMIGQALADGYVLVSAGLRSRGDANHSPVTVGDAKAVIRYLYHNAEQGLLPAGNTENIIISGHSGGGALVSAVGSSGNAVDYLPYLYALGAAGVEYTGSEAAPTIPTANVDTDTDFYNYDPADFADTLQDDVFGVMASAPITDLDNADAIYGWTFSTGKIEGEKGEAEINNSLAYGVEFTEYVAGLELEYNGEALLATFDEETGARGGTMEELLEAKFIEAAQKALDEEGKDALLADVSDSSWITISADGKTVLDIDMDGYLYYNSTVTALKGSPAFNAVAAPGKFGLNESNLFGEQTSTAGFASEIAFNEAKAIDHAATEGYDTWADYQAANAELVSSQAKMIDSTGWLTTYAGESDPADYWYVYQGMLDRDTAQTNPTLLYVALLNSEDVKDAELQFVWNRNHGRGYWGIEDAYAWMTEKLAASEEPETPDVPVVPSTPSKPEVPEVCPGDENCPAYSYNDIDTSKWYHEAVDYVVSEGLFKGVAEGEFAPNGQMNRAMFWTVLARMAGAELDESGAIWYEAAMNWAIKEGISDGTMAKDSITREQIITMLWRYVGSPKSEASLDKFGDADSISAWAVEAMKWAVEIGVVGGYEDNTLRAKNTATRAEVAQLIMNYLAK